MANVWVETKFPNAAESLWIVLQILMIYKVLGRSTWFTFTAMETVLTGRHLAKRYGQLAILTDVSLSLQSAEIVSIVGASGAGKSTLLHILGTLEQPDQGSVEIDGQDVTRLSRTELAKFRNRHIGFVFQFHHLLPEFTALENVCIPAWIAGTDKREAHAYALQLLHLLGLSERAQHKPSQLSGGEQQRVAVARALINKPTICFADEPTGNLDSVHAAELHALFFELRQQLKQTFLIVTHNEALAAMSDRQLTMKDGQLVH